MDKGTRIVAGLVTGLVLIALVLVTVSLTVENTAAQNVPCYITQGGALVVAGQDCDYAFKPQTALTVATDTEIAPTGVLQPITSAGDVGTGDIADGFDGQFLMIVNTGPNTITLTDTAKVNVGSSNVALGPDDTITLTYIESDSAWFKIASADN